MQHQSNYSSVGKQLEWVAVDQKDQKEETINSEEDLCSNYSNKQQKEQFEEVNINLPSKQLQPVNSYQSSVREKQESVQKCDDQQILQTEQKENEELVVPNKPPLRPSMLTPFHKRDYNDMYKQQKSYPESEISLKVSNNKPRKNSRLKIYTFYYDNLNVQESSLIRLSAKSNPIKFVFLESMLPISIVFLLFIVIIYIQKRINDYCYLESICQCSKFGVKIWSFIRQMIVNAFNYIQQLFKLAQIVYRKKILEKVFSSELNSSTQKPVMEYMILLVMTMMIDVLLVLWIENNDVININFLISFTKDWVYYIIVSIIGLVIFLNTFRLKNWFRALYKGRGYILYDFCFLSLLLFIFFVIPNIQKQFLINYGEVNGTQYFLYFYVIIDFILECSYDTILNMSQWSELYIHQAYLIIIGVRIGVLLTQKWNKFEFWYTILVMGLIRINNMSMLITVIIRRQLFYKCPRIFQSIFYMNENSIALKGKHGANLEHMAWIFFLYMFWLTESTLTFYVKGFTIIQNCNFETKAWNNIIDWYQPIIIWILFAIFEIIGYYLNKIKAYDNIKWIGGESFNILENIFIRCIGWYFFIQAILVPLLVEEISDIQSKQQFLNDNN